jgi:hypothetical protein
MADSEMKSEQVPSGKCPRCSNPVDDFELDRMAAGGVVIILKPCGCSAHSNERGYYKFMEFVRV